MPGDQMLETRRVERVDTGSAVPTPNAELSGSAPAALTERSLAAVSLAQHVHGHVRRNGTQAPEHWIQARTPDEADTDGVDRWPLEQISLHDRPSAAAVGALDAAIERHSQLRRIDADLRERSGPG